MDMCNDLIEAEYVVWVNGFPEREWYLIFIGLSLTRIFTLHMQDENEEGHDGSYLDCYMKENPGMSIEMHDAMLCILFQRHGSSSTGNASLQIHFLHVSLRLASMLQGWFL